MRTLILLALFARPAAAYKCDHTVFPPGPPPAPNTFDPTPCVPPMLQAVEKDSFSFVFKVDDADQAAQKSIVVAFYDDSHTATNTPARCITVSNTSCSDTKIDAACYHKIKSSQFGIPLVAGHEYAYNVNVGGTCTQPGGVWTVTGGTWFDARRHVTTAPTGRPQTISFAIIGDTRDGGQGTCGAKDAAGLVTPGKALFSYGDIAAGSNCGGSRRQRAEYADEVAAWSPNVILHTGDIGSSDRLNITAGYWQDIGYYWRNFSTTFMYGNHEFGSPEGVETGGQEYLGTHWDTFADDMIAVPPTPVSGGSDAYPPGAVTYYAQNYANIHFVYLNSQLCILDAYNGGASCNGYDPPTTRYESNGSNESGCSCWTHSNAQRDWLEEDLYAANADPNIDFIIVGMHKPFWSNGADSYKTETIGTGQQVVHTGDSPTDEWTNTIGRREYAIDESSGYNLSFTGGLQTAGSSGFAQTGFKPLDAIFQMYNVDLFINSHAHYYEHLTDHRYRPTSDPGLPHLIVGGGGSAEQAYQCPGFGGPCTAASAAYPENHLPVGVNLNRAIDGNFYFGSGWVDNGAHALQVYTVQIDDSSNSSGIVDSFPGSGIVSRKAQIRNTAGLPNHSGWTDPFNGCNLVYSSTTGLAVNGPYAPPALTHDINCTVR